jgi:hypothetical protein
MTQCGKESQVDIVTFKTQIKFNIEESWVSRETINGRMLISVSWSTGISRKLMRIS